MSVISIYNKTSVSSHFSDHNLTSLLGEKRHHAVPANTEVVLYRSMLAYSALRKSQGNASIGFLMAKYYSNPVKCVPHVAM